MCIFGHSRAAEILSDFADVAQIQEFCSPSLGAAQGADLIASIAWVKTFLTDHAELIEQATRKVIRAMCMATCMRAASS